MSRRSRGRRSVAGAWYVADDARRRLLLVPLPTLGHVRWPNGAVGMSACKAPEPNPAAPLVWMDLEMTGLDAATDTILEIATLVTDADLNVLAEGPALAIHHGDDVLAGMDDWNREHHAASGLADRVRRSATSLTEAEAVTLAFVRRHCAPGTSPLCGNSVWQDRRFLARLMPTLEAHLHYRLIDVSTVKELARRWGPQLLANFEKRNTHRALDDVRESIAELRHYRQSFFKVQ